MKEDLYIQKGTVTAVQTEIWRIKEQIQGIQWIRALFKPWKDWKYEKAYRMYLESGKGDKLKEFHNRYFGKRCFIIGNGPSLSPKDLDRLQYEYTFAANRIYKIYDRSNWRPCFYVAVDPNFIEPNRGELLKNPSTYMFLDYDGELDQKENIYQIFERKRYCINRGADKSAFVEEDVTKGFSCGWTVTFVSIQLAIYMGFKEIYLLGVDFNYAYYIDEHGAIRYKDGVNSYFDGAQNNTSRMNYTATLHAFQVSQQYCERHDVKIYNATRGGMLEVFPRVDFDSLIPVAQNNWKG